MITWMLAFLFYILILVFGETAANFYLTKFVQPAEAHEEATVKEN